MKIYLTNFSIMIDNYYYPLYRLNQRSILCTTLSSIYIYICHITDLIKNFFNTHYHIFANDIQLLPFPP